MLGLKEVNSIVSFRLELSKHLPQVLNSGRLSLPLSPLCLKSPPLAEPAQLEQPPLYRQKGWLHSGRSAQPAGGEQSSWKTCAWDTFCKGLKLWKGWVGESRKKRFPACLLPNVPTDSSTLFSPFTNHCALPYNLTNFAVPIVSAFSMTRAVKFKLVYTAVKLKAFTLSVKQC